MNQKDWWWVAPEGLVNKKQLIPIKAIDPKSQRLLVKKKSLIIIIHHYDHCGKVRKEWTTSDVIEADPRIGGVSLQMLSDALSRRIPSNSEFGLQPLKVAAEDDYSVVCFLGFDH